MDERIDYSLARHSEALLFFLRTSIWGTSSKYNNIEINWDCLMDLSSRHGVLAWVWDGICKQPEYLQAPRQVKISWELSAQEIRDNYWEQKKILDQIVNICNDNSIKLLLLKGFGLSLHYPEPQFRPSGDIDIYLFGDFEKGNKLLSRGNVEFDGREATFYINNIAIENHAYLIYKKTQKEKKIEKYLESTLNHCINTKENYYILPPTSEIIYNLMHTLTHFNSATYPLPLRSIVDFGMCLNSFPHTLIVELRDTLDKLSIIKSFSLFVALTEMVLKRDFVPFHFSSVPQEDVDKAYNLVLTGSIKQKKVPWNLSFKEQAQLRKDMYKELKWMNSYLPYSTFEIIRGEVHTQLLIMTKSILGIPAHQHFKDGVKMKFIRK